MESNLDMPRLPLGCPGIRSLGSNQVGIFTSKDLGISSLLFPCSVVTAAWQTALSQIAFFQCSHHQ